MKKLIALIVCVALIVTVAFTVDFKDLGRTITKTIEEISQYTGKTVRFEVKESTRVEPAAIPTDAENSYFCYQEINNEQKRLYRIILTAVKNMTDGFIELGSCNDTFSADISIAYQAVANDHPELFWMPYSYLVNSSGAKKEPNVFIAMSYKGNKNSCDWLVSKKDKNYMQDLLTEAVDEITNAVNGLSRYEAEVYFHDYLCKNTIYTLGEPEDLVYTAYGSLIRGEAVCEGYSRAMQLLCQRVGIPCMLVSGLSDGTGHLWNLVDPGDGWYHLDVTWDDNEENTGNPYKFYFNVTENEILLDRNFYPDITYFKGKKSIGENFNIHIEECFNTKYNYYKYEKLIFDGNYKTAVPSGIYEAHLNNRNSADFKFTDDQLFKKFEKDYQSYVEEIQKVLKRSSSGIVITNISIVKNTVIFYW